MFCWGKLINMIDDNKGGRVRILEDFTLCNLMLVQEEAARTWFKQDHKNGDPYTHTLKVAFDPATDSDDKIMFFCQVRSKMIAKRIPGSGAMYQFVDVETLKTTVRGMLDDSMAPEANRCFEFAIKLFGELENG